VDRENRGQTQKQGTDHDLEIVVCPLFLQIVVCPLFALSPVSATAGTQQGLSAVQTVLTSL